MTAITALSLIISGLSIVISIKVLVGLVGQRRTLARLERDAAALATEIAEQDRVARWSATTAANDALWAGHH